MGYSIAAILHPRLDKNNLQKVQVRIIHNRKKYYLPTDIKIEKKYFIDGAVSGHPKSDRYNQNIRKIIGDAEDLALDQINRGKKELSFQIETSKDKLIIDFIEDYLEDHKESYSAGSIKHYKTVGNKIADWKPELMMSQITIEVLEDFEKHLRKSHPNGNKEKKLDINTVNNVMKRLKALLTKSGIEESQFRKYKVPAYKQKDVEYLSETEIEKFFDLVKIIEKPGHKLAGYYFLLSCFTGYRLSDAKRFDYRHMIRDDKITLRAKKNSRIVSIPIHSRLKEVLSFIKDNPFNLSEQKARLYIKSLCNDIGIKRNIVFHSSRHSFAMLLMSKGFTTDEVAELIGDSLLVTKIYARVHNESLSKKITERLG